MSLGSVARTVVARLASRASSGLHSRRRVAPARVSASSRRRALGAGLAVFVLASRGHSAMAASSVSYPAPIVVSPPEGGETKAVCIFLHGLGDTGHGWADVAGQMPFEGVKWIFPTAPTIPITLNGGMRMTGWYDINDLSIDGIVDDRERTLASAAYVTGLVDEAIASGVPSEKILIGGFSQGGVVALTASLRSDKKLAGCVAMSTYLAMRDDYPAALGAHAKTMPVFLAHGTADQVLKYEYGEATAAKLDELGLARVDFKTYRGMAHSACQEELQHLAAFIAGALSDA
jgi:predicted esterase